MYTLHDVHQALMQLHGRAKRATKCTGVPAPDFGEYAKRLYRDNICQSDDPVYKEQRHVVAYAVNEARAFRDEVNRVGATLRRFGKWDAREAARLAIAVAELLKIDHELTKEDVLSRLGGPERLPVPDWRAG